MACFYHPTVGAVGICKHCGRGLCPACAAEVEGDGLACRNRHEAQVQLLHRLTGQATRSATRQGVMLLGLGGFIAVLGLFAWLTTGFTVAVVFLVFALFCLVIGAVSLHVPGAAQRQGPG